MAQRKKIITVQCKHCGTHQQEQSMGTYWECLYCNKIGNKREDYSGEVPS